MIIQTRYTHFHVYGQVFVYGSNNELSYTKSHIKSHFKQVMHPQHMFWQGHLYVTHSYEKSYPYHNVLSRQGFTKAWKEANVLPWKDCSNNIIFSLYKRILNIIRGTTRKTAVIVWKTCLMGRVLGSSIWGQGAAAYRVRDITVATSNTWHTHRYLYIYRYNTVWRDASWDCV